MTKLTRYDIDNGIPGEKALRICCHDKGEWIKAADVEAVLKDCTEILDDIASGEFEYMKGFRARANKLLDRLKGTP